MIYDANGNERRPMTPLDRNVLWLVILYAVMWLLLLAFGAFAQNAQLSPGPVLLTSPATISPDSERAVYADATGVWSVPLQGGAPVRLSQPFAGGQSARFSVSPDSSRVVFVTDAEVIGVPDLWSTPTTGGAITKLSPDLSALPGQVLDFAISPTNLRAYYLADTVTNNVIELWRVDIGGGPSTRLNRAIGVDYDIFSFAVSPQDRIVYRSGTSTVGKYRLFSVPGNGRSVDAREISRAMVTGGSAMEFEITPDGQRTIYRADALQNGRFDLFSVALTGGTSTRLDRDDGRSVRAAFTVDATGVTYSYTPTEFYRVPVTGGASVPVPPPVTPPMKSPDGLWEVFASGISELSSSRGGIVRRLSCAGQAVTTSFLAKPAYSISSDSRAVVYIANDALWSSPISGAVCLLFRDGFESGSTSAWQ